VEAVNPRQCPTCKESEPAVAFYRAVKDCKECHKRRVRDWYHARHAPPAVGELDALTRDWGRK
jgi:hypothetical protein